MIEFPYETYALRVVQPLGTFFVAILPAELLLQVAASDTMSAHLDPDGLGYSLTGTQRLIQDKRLSQIADYIDRFDSAFPNAVILAANYNIEFGLDQNEKEAIDLEEGDRQPPITPLEWAVSDDGNGICKIVIPTNAKLAAIIDGQHRLFAFTRANRQRLAMPLLCAVFIDLPKPFQAQLFATINSTQKPVDRSLTYELFGYNVSEEDECYWTPDKLAVFLARKLATDVGSPMFSRITVAPKMDRALEDLLSSSSWRVSTAVVVDGILRLISTNPKRDSNKMRSSQAAPRSVLSDGPSDRAPLRAEFINRNDMLVYTLVRNFLAACDEVFWVNAAPGSFIRKTVGIQALFDVLRKIAQIVITEKDIRVERFVSLLTPAADIDFSGGEFKVPSGSGRSKIRQALEARIKV